jgi:hypothetical protein
MHGSEQMPDATSPTAPDLKGLLGSMARAAESRTFVVLFFTIWGLTIFGSGFLIGVGIGWFPSFIAAFVLTRSATFLARLAGYAIGMGILGLMVFWLPEWITRTVWSLEGAWRVVFFVVVIGGGAVAIWRERGGWGERAVVESHALTASQPVSGAEEVPIEGPLAVCPRCRQFALRGGPADSLVCDCGYNVSARTLIVGSLKSQVYHRPTCRRLSALDRSDAVLFGWSWDAALAGHAACEVCTPPPVYRHSDTR